MPAQIWTTARRAKFLKTLAETGNVSAAARAAKASRSRAYQLKTEDAGFAEEWSEALEMATDALDAEARRRAMDGVDTPRFHQGQIAGTVKKYSDSLLMFLLRAHRPDLYRERTAAANSRQDGHDDTEDYAGARDALADRLARLDPDAGDGPDGGTDPAGGLTDRDAAHLLHDWPLWARAKQLPPPGDWRVWLILAGRGFGKTRTGAEWVRALAEGQRAGRIALVGETASDARDVMVEGESGLLACCPPWARPLYEPSKRRVTSPNGAMATCFSADDPDQLRGPQFDAAWADEIAKWRYEAAWDNLMLGLRLGLDPRCVATTTPKPRAWLSRLMADPRTMVTRGGTRENAANLAPAFLDQILARYDGTRLGRQEIEGEYLVDTPGALWTRALLAASRADGAVPDLARIVVAVDPAVTSGAESDETGIVVAGRDAANGFWVLEDLTARLSPDLWARRAVEAYGRHRADAVVCEVNQGGDLVAATLRTVDPALPVRAVRATRGKRLRAEPVAALYEQGRVRHAGAFPEMEDQMTGFTGASGEASPDRLDALVWALTDLMSGPRAAESREFLV